MCFHFIFFIYFPNQSPLWHPVPADGAVCRGHVGDGNGALYFFKKKNQKSINLLCVKCTYLRAMPEHFFHEGFGVGQVGLVQEAQRSLSLPRRRRRTDLNRQQSIARILFNKNQNVFSTSSISSLKSLSCDSGKAARYSTIHSREVAAVSVPKNQIWNIFF